MRSAYVVKSVLALSVRSDALKPRAAETGEKLKVAETGEKNGDWRSGARKDARNGGPESNLGFPVGIMGHDPRGHTPRLLRRSEIALTN